MTLIEVLLALFILMLVSVAVSQALITVLRLESQSKYQFELSANLATVLHDHIQWGAVKNTVLADEGWQLEEGEKDAGQFIRISPVENPRISASMAVSRQMAEID